MGGILYISEVSQETLSKDTIMAATAGGIPFQELQLFPKTT
jgi:hypothetical protein